MTAQVDPFSSIALQVKAGYYRMPPAEKLSVLLRNAHFVEFPTIEVWKEFRGAIVDAQGAVTHQVEAERKPKRRKLDRKAGKKTINGLLGEYGSEEEDQPEEPNVLSTLGGYAGSDEEMEAEVEVEEEEEEEEEDRGKRAEQEQNILEEDVQETDEDGDEVLDLDPTVLLQLMQQMQGDQNWVSNTGDDEVDWDGGEPG